MKNLQCVFLSFLLFFTGRIEAYPIDGFVLTGIRRLERLRLSNAGEMQGPISHEGAKKSIHDIRLHLNNPRGDSLDFPLIADPVLQREIDTLFPNRHESYSIAVLDITPGESFRYAARQPDRTFSPGSVGKLAVIAGLMNELQRLYPTDPEQRRLLLKERMVTADQWIRHDSHVVPVFDPETHAYQSRPIREGDVFSLYEWADHMISASANAAASVVWKEAILMRAFAMQYPPTYEEEVAYFHTTPKKTLQDLAAAVVNDPLRDAEIAEEAWRLGSLFTRRGKEIIPGSGSWASPNGLLTYLIRLEQGRIVDAWSSLEIKRLMYTTTKRIRYASAPRLNPCAVYFKSGSLYRCKAEEGFTCKKYMGNVENLMNSVAIVERPDGRIYCVALMSDILYKNSAVEHQTLSTYVDKIITR